MKTKPLLLLLTFSAILSTNTFGQGGAIGNFRPAFGALPLGWTDLSQGTYTYTLVADGKIVATKKMMKQ